MHAMDNQNQNKSTLIMYLVTIGPNFRFVFMEKWQI